MSWMSCIPNEMALNPSFHFLYAQISTKIALLLHLICIETGSTELSLPCGMQISPLCSVHSKVFTHTFYVWTQTFWAFLFTEISLTSVFNVIPFGITYVLDEKTSFQICVLLDWFLNLGIDPIWKEKTIKLDRWEIWVQRNEEAVTEQSICRFNPYTIFPSNSEYI